MKSAKASESGIRFAEANLRPGYANGYAMASVTQSARRFAKATRFMYYVYSLKCRDGYYVGCTDNIGERLNRHSKGNVPATADRLPINLEFYFATEDKYKAFEFEKYLKSGSGRAFISKHF